MDFPLVNLRSVQVYIPAWELACSSPSSKVQMLMGLLSGAVLFVFELPRWLQGDLSLGYCSWVVGDSVIITTLRGRGYKFINQLKSNLRVWLVGGLEHCFYFSIYWEFHHPNWRTHIFQRGRAHQPDESWGVGPHSLTNHDRPWTFLWDPTFWDTRPGKRLHGYGKSPCY